MNAEYFTLEGHDNWSGSAFYFADADHRKPFLFSGTKDYAHRFATEADARATADMIVAYSEKDPFLGYEQIELVCHHTPLISQVYGRYDLHYYRAP